MKRGFTVKKIITHYPHPKEVIDCILVRRDYLNLLQNDRCASEILAVFEYWTQDKFEQIQSNVFHDYDQLWIPRSAAQLRQDLYEGYGINTVNRALIKLVEKGFLERRRNPNPQLNFDRTWQYKFNIPRVQKALDELSNRR